MICHNMPKDKYILPEVDSLKDIGFRFEYSKKSDAIPYINSFVKDNFNVLQDLYFFENAHYDGSGKIIDLVKSENPNDTVDEWLNEHEKDLVAKIKRLENGDIKPRDFLFHVHPIHANNPEVLLRSYDKDLRAFYGSKGILMYRGSRWGLNVTDSINECFYHRILDDFIYKIKAEGIIEHPGISDVYLKMKELLEDSSETDVKDGPGNNQVEEDKNTKTLAYYQGRLMSENNTIEKSAKRTVWKSLRGVPIESTIEEKESTIKYYLSLQASLVKKAKDKSRRNRGIHKSKRDEVIRVFKSNRKLSHVKIAEITGVNRKTVAKYINELSGE